MELKRFFVTLSILIGFLIVGIMAGYLAGITWANLQGGRFSSWQELESILKFEKISEATLQIVWAKTIDGELYSWDTNCTNEPNCNQWTPAKDIPDTVYKYGGQSTKRFRTCPKSRLKGLADPPGDVVECVLFSSSGLDIKAGRLVYYALLDDGTIWTLRCGYPSMDTHGSGLLFGAAAFVATTTTEDSLAAICFPCNASRARSGSCTTMRTTAESAVSITDNPQM